MNRTLGFTITVAWLLCMTALIQRDVLPLWQAQEPPTQPIPPGTAQVGIHNEAGQRLGTTWVTTTPVSTFTTVHALTRLDVGAVTKMLPIDGEIFINTDLTYDGSHVLKEFLIRLDTALLSARITGIHYGDEYACTAKIGRLTKTLSFDGRLSQYLSDAMRPFTYLEGLHVGQTWRLRLIDPLALLKGESLDFTTQLVEVTRRETIEHGGGHVDCYRIETDGAVAWADESGRVLRQEIQVPMLGKWVLLEEPFDRQARQEARRVATDMRGNRSARRGANKDASSGKPAGVAPGS